MWISKKKWKAMEKKIADLEEKVQGQQKAIIYLSHKDHPSKELNEVLDSTQCCPISTFQVDLDSKTLFLQTSEQSS